jgi:hypothetical protein
MGMLISDFNTLADYINKMFIIQGKSLIAGLDFPIVAGRFVFWSSCPKLTFFT